MCSNTLLSVLVLLYGLNDVDANTMVQCIIFIYFACCCRLFVLLGLPLSLLYTYGVFFATMFYLALFGVFLRDKSHLYV